MAKPSPGVVIGGGVRALAWQLAPSRPAPCCSCSCSAATHHVGWEAAVAAHDAIQLVGRAPACAAVGRKPGQER